LAALILGFECCVSSWKGISNRYLSCFIYFEEAKNGLKSIRIVQQKPKQKVRKKKKVIFGRVPFFQGSLCIRRCGVGVGVRCGSVCVRSCASEAARVGRRGIWNRVCSFSPFLPCHHSSEHRQRNCNHDYAERDEDDEIRGYLRYPCAEDHDFSQSI